MKNQFTPKDIIWIKNVTDHKVGQAYMDLLSDKFVMLFPNQHRGNILSPQIGDIILIRQYVNGISAFTHLVTPIDDEIVEENIHRGFLSGRNVQVIAMTPINDLIKTSSVKWKGVFSQGNARRIDKLITDGTVDEFRSYIWQRFEPYFWNKQND